jgi:hypothetical protein
MIRIAVVERIRTHVAFEEAEHYMLGCGSLAAGWLFSGHTEIVVAVMYIGTGVLTSRHAHTHRGAAASSDVTARDAQAAG